ncbi:OVCH2 [Anthophora plagiata]
MSLYILFFLILINLREHKNVLLRGKRAQDGQFPWLIQFQTIAPCGGVLLSPDWVLTAAQCVQDKRNSIILFAAGLNGTGSKQTVPVKATYIYPMYQAYSVLPDRDYNIALLKLTKPFDICHSKIILPNVQPIKYDNYKLCLIFGWQSYVSLSSRVLAKPIQYYEVILNTWKMCTYMIKANKNYTNIFCTMVEFKDEIKACAGNPGSPVVCENQNRETALLGIASWTNFSLDCGDLPTYLDLDAFRIWMNDLVFNNKNIREWEKSSKLNEKHCKFKSKTSVYNNSWNGSDLTQSGSQINYWPEETKVQSYNVSEALVKYQETSTVNKNKSHFWNKLYQSLLNNFNDTNTSDDYYTTSYVPIVKESSNDIYKYEEIGSFQNNDQIVENLKEQDQFNIVNKSLLCNNQKIDKVAVKHNNQIEIDDFEFLLPFNFEDVTVSYSSNDIYSKNLCLFFAHVFWYLCISIYM